LNRIAQQFDDMLPDGLLQVIRPDHALWTRRRSSILDTILTMATVIAPLRMNSACSIRNAEHGQTTGLAVQKAAQQVIIFGIVAE
jgi:hypothetical protein